MQGSIPIPAFVSSFSLANPTSPEKHRLLLHLCFLERFEPTGATGARAPSTAKRPTLLRLRCRRRHKASVVNTFPRPESLLYSAGTTTANLLAHRKEFGILFGRQGSPDRVIASRARNWFYLSFGRPWRQVRRFMSGGNASLSGSATKQEYYLPCLSTGTTPRRLCTPPRKLERYS